MSSFLRFVCILTLAAASIGVSQAALTSPVQQQQGSSIIALETEPAPISWLDSVWRWPVLNFFASLFQLSSDSAPVQSASEIVHPDESVPVSACSVAPLDPILDPEAQQLEASVGSDGVVDVSDMVPAASRALDRFESEVTAVGGTITLKSAYRPMAYQQHLANVWHKWMYELRDNADPACQDLRAQVQDEFQRHHLIETQHPVAISDHTRGLAFDATVDLPARARLGRRRVTLDSLAHLAGLLRPAISSDPVHFKFVGGELPSRRNKRLA